MLITIVITALVCALVVTTGLAYHYRGEADFMGELLNESAAQFLKDLDHANAHLKGYEEENNQLSTTLSTWMRCSFEDSRTIRNMTASVEALSAELDAIKVDYARGYLADDVYMPEDECTCPFNYDDRIEAPCKDVSCTCVHHKFASIEADEL